MIDVLKALKNMKLAKSEKKVLTDIWKAWKNIFMIGPGFAPLLCLVKQTIRSSPLTFITSKAKCGNLESTLSQKPTN